ncbi:MAG: HypC/HybG/HupF family hydrogenase formation chaperone [Candidatus Aminicenantes bacterium]|nr:HypC/HybG/HupF family hydrogenase formation chaperone [Candidatus Aminicenantes bacterium]
MCLAVPMQVTEINGEMGKVEIGGVCREVGLMLLEDIRIGDWVIVHAGIAISKINDQEAEETLKLFKEGGMI